jgi:general secretion pathway protein C
MMARWMAFTVWAAVAASAVFWGLKFFAQAAPAPAHAGVTAPTMALKGDLTRLLGVDPPPKAIDAAPVVAESARFQLVGVVSPRGAAAPGQGVALIAVDGKPARAYKVGAVVDGSQVLQAVQARGASLGPRGGATAISLEIPPMPPAATGSLPAAVSGDTMAPTGAKPLPGLPVVRPPMPGMNRPGAGLSPSMPNASVNMAPSDAGGGGESPALR